LDDNKPQRKIKSLRIFFSIQSNNFWIKKNLSLDLAANKEMMLQLHDDPKM